VAYYGDDPDWVTVRPPLMELGTDKTRSLVAELNRLGFKMPGLAEATARV
jgi:4-hydroxy-tetrahydrodipicolinate synthase